jgi:hypothetical protein
VTRTRRAGAVLGLTLVLGLVAGSGEPGGASGAATFDDAGRDELVDLAARAAAGDDAALTRLRLVDRVDGRRVDLRRALEDHARSRADTLARWDGRFDGAPGPPGPPAPAGEVARRQAEQVLAQPEFRPSSTPRPLRGLLRRLGEVLEPVLGPVVRAAERVWADPVARVAAALAAIAAVTIASAALVRRRARAVAGERDRTRRRSAVETPEALERSADAAERAGDGARAYRLRFRAGVLRLAREGALAYRPTLTTGDLRRQLHSPAFDALASRFDEIAYGGGTTTAPDLDAVRSAWPRVRQEAGAP